MKQIILILLILGFTFISASAQKAQAVTEITDRQWQELLTAVSGENWETAFELSTGYLKQLKNDDRAKSIGNLRYICLYSAAGKVFTGKMSYDKLQDVIKDFVGKKLVFPYRQIAAEGRCGFNLICASEKARNQAMVTAANQAGTSILAFEYIQLKDDFDFAAHAGQEAAVSGVAQSIVPNPNRSNIVILRIYIADGDISLAAQKQIR